ncbi:hypothetical protein FAEPRAA2165_02664 [Faecalibacterium duncaniae]|uniref:Uncharacterized protein n=1 Tax=Faecalibacterium duncaniae (strain DSM 17677 / JCM 31915 / A2-165) TaxID=411483 RepID=C7H8M2_FAED2|nr:hypothetical protein FAEPRAA2165_02664 [Faecalibacterium duncaniae]
MGKRRCSFNVSNLQIVHPNPYNALHWGLAQCARLPSWQQWFLRLDALHFAALFLQYQVL